MCFEAWKMTRRHQGAKMERFMLKAAHENWTIQFGIPEYPIFPEEIKSH
jgi:hypothetical protein